MLGNIKTIDGKENIVITNAPFQGYINREGYFKVEVCHLDTSTKEKGYIVIYLVDLDKKVIMTTILKIKSTSGSNDELPLEKLIKLSLEDELETGGYCFSVDIDHLIGLECQILVKREFDYFNIKDVFPIDEELGKYVSQVDELRSRFPNGLFNN